MPNRLDGLLKETIEEIPETSLPDVPTGNRLAGLLDDEEQKRIDDAMKSFSFKGILKEEQIFERQPRTLDRELQQMRDFNYDDAIGISNELKMPFQMIENAYPEIEGQRKFLKTFTDDGFDIRVGLGETVQRMDALEYANRFVPFFPGKAIEMIELQGAVTRLQEDDYPELRVPVGHITEEPQTPQKLRESDVRMLEDFFHWQEELAIRGQTWGTKAFIGMTHLPKWMMEFLLTGGLKELGSEAAKNTAVRILKGYMYSPGGKTTLRAAGWVGGAITRASLGLEHRVIEEIFQKKLPKQIKFGPNDELVIEVEGENWASSIIKGWANVVIEAASEEAGAEITKHLTNLVGKMPFGKKIVDGIYTAWFEKHQTSTVTQFYNEFFTKAGYSNIIGEIGEERLSTILRATLHTDSFGLPEDSKVFERLSAGLSADIQNFPIEALVLAVPGATRYVGGQLIRKFSNPTMKIVNRYNSKIKKAEKRNDNKAIESLRAMEQYELAQLAAPVYTAYQQMEKAVEEAPTEAIPTPEAPPTKPITPEKAVEVSPEAKLTAQQEGMKAEALRTAQKEGIEVTPEGNLILYHGTRSAQKIRESGTLPIGTYFAADKTIAKRFAEQAQQKGEAEVMRVEVPAHKIFTSGGEELYFSANEPITFKPPTVEAEPTKVVEPEVIPPTENDYNQSQLDTAALDAQQASNEYLEQDAPPDTDIPEPTDEDIGIIKGIFHDLGIKEKGDYEPLNDKDYREIYKFLQMPDDVRRTFPQFDPVYQVQRGREIAKSILDNQFADSTLPYFQLTKTDKMIVDKALFEAERNPNLTFGPKRLSALGLNEAQIKGFLAIRTSLDTAQNLLIQRMKDYGVDEEAITEFVSKIKNYVPHKWYGNWAVVAKEDKKTVFMSVTTRSDRFTERDRLKKLYPDATVVVMRRKSIPYEAFQEAPPFAVQRMLELTIEKAEANPDTKAAMQEALSDLYKSKGFGMHYIKRKDTPGYTENLQRPLAEYFAGFTGYLTKMDAIKAFPGALSGIHPQRTPNLYKYAADYIKYTTGDQLEFAQAKRAMYFYYLYGNIKSTALNMTQNITLGWPVLSKHTGFALPKMLQAMARTATPGMLAADEKVFLAKMEEAGHFDPKLAQEVSGFAGNPLYTSISTKGRKALSFFDIFRHMEHFNRRSMAVALYDSGVTDIDKAAELIEEAHFRYGKGNRPTLARGFISPVMTFRSWGINYMTWLKNETKTKRISAMGRSLSAVVLFGGLKALPGFGAIAYMWRRLFGTDIEAEAREAMGVTFGKVAMRGVPANYGISFTGSIGIGDIPTDLKSLGGVFADIPKKITNVARDIRIGDYRRALEDASPESLRNPLAAYRMHRQGIRSRSGKPVVDVESGGILKLTRREAITKTLGFQPLKLAEQWDIADFVNKKHKERIQRKQTWVDKFFLGFLNKDIEAMKEVLQDFNTHNASMKKRGRDNDIIDMKELDNMLRERMQIANIPAKSMLETFAKIRKQYYGK